MLLEINFLDGFAVRSSAQAYCATAHTGTIATAPAATFVIADRFSQKRCRCPAPDRKRFDLPTMNCRDDALQNGVVFEDELDEFRRTCCQRTV
jgi:hypothetical protein